MSGKIVTLRNLPTHSVSESVSIRVVRRSAPAESAKGFLASPDYWVAVGEQYMIERFLLANP